MKVIKFVSRKPSRTFLDGFMDGIGAAAMVFAEPKVTKRHPRTGEPWDPRPRLVKVKELAVNIR